MKRLILILSLMISLFGRTQTSCACVYQNPNTFEFECFSGNCGNNNFQNCLSRLNYTWFQGVSAPSGMTICEYLLSEITLPIELYSFSVKNYDRYNKIEWITLTEYNNDYFILERSIDGYNWFVINVKNGAGNTTDINEYSYNDFTYEAVINYYKLKQVDFDGSITKYNIVSIDNRDKEIIKRINLLGQEVDENYIGIIIIIYSDGSIKKVLK
jgi:hypothetical protein